MRCENRAHSLIAISYLQRGAHTKREGLTKLVWAYVVSPLLVSVLWALTSVPLMLVLSIPYVGEPEHTGWQMLQAMPRAYFYVFNRLILLTFPLTAIALMLGGYFFWRLRWFKEWHINLYACICVQVIAVFFSNYELGKFILFQILFGVFIAPVAVTISTIFWHIGIKNNHWLLRRYGVSNP